MLNQIVLVGRISSDLKVKKLENGVNFNEFKLEVPRNYKNENGEYETDFVPVQTFKGVAVSTADYCKVGDLVGIKGRLQTDKDKLKVIVEKITFLSSKKEGEVMG